MRAADISLADVLLHVHVEFTHRCMHTDTFALTKTTILLHEKGSHNYVLAGVALFCKVHTSYTQHVHCRGEFSMPPILSLRSTTNQQDTKCKGLGVIQREVLG